MSTAHDQHGHDKGFHDVHHHDHVEHHYEESFVDKYWPVGLISFGCACIFYVGCYKIFW